MRRKWGKGGAAGCLCVGMAVLLLAGCGKSDDAAVYPGESALLMETDEAEDGAATGDAAGDGSGSEGSVRIGPEQIRMMAPAVMPESVEVTADMYEKAFVNPGSLSRLADCLERAAAGEEITLAYIGGSITDGDTASPKETACYAYLTTKWWEDSFPAAQIHYINAGIGATDSYLGVHRVEADVLSHEPDLVVVEYSVNDVKPMNKETYESLLRRILADDSSPAVVSLLLGTAGSSYAAEHALVAYHYQVPIVSYQALLAGGDVSWESVGSSDRVHPANEGHALIASLLTTLYRETALAVSGEADTAADQPYIQRIREAAATGSYVLPEDSLTHARYTDACLFYEGEILPVRQEGYERGEDRYILPGRGWATEEGGTIAFSLDCATLGIAYYEWKNAPEGGIMDCDVYLDGEYICTITPYDGNTWGNHLEYREFLRDDESGTHELSLCPSEGSEGQCFEILGLCVGY